ALPRSGPSPCRTVRTLSGAKNLWLPDLWCKTGWKRRQVEHALEPGESYTHNFPGNSFIALHLQPPGWPFRLFEHLPAQKYTVQIHFHFKEWNLRRDVYWVGQIQSNPVEVTIVEKPNK
ncbi:MAG: hypothetical protein NZ700_13850, partial [Gemmataceae bacterium]|nr:hypothetical protein [Gemmataceae bacterium]